MPIDIFITGIGMVSPAGCSTQTTWSSLLTNQKHVRLVQGVDLNGCNIKFAGQIHDFAPLKDTENLGRLNQFAVAAAEQAITSANLNLKCQPTGNHKNMLVLFGYSKCDIEYIYSNYSLFPNDTNYVNNSTLVYNYTNYCHKNKLTPNYLLDTPAVHIAHRFNITGGIYSAVAACSTGTHAIIRAAQMIHDSDANIIIAGSADTPIHPLWMGAYEQMGVLAEKHPQLGTEWACRPFDKTRNGFAVGEGAAVLVLESSESVNKRKCKPIARIAGYAMGHDPAGLTSLNSDGKSLAHVIKLACHMANCRPQQISCIHAHGTATPSNDLVEVRAIKQALGKLADQIPIISIKGAIGHLLGGAGAVETAVAALTCKYLKCPGTTTLINPDPELGELLLPRDAFDIVYGPVLKISLGFGGHLAAMLIEPA
ncbi:MAG: beta-ketoacyl-[acyl-carrier-protein] synthase family protein [Planctomycetota bacterium]|nr:MAG: beta-ketoacyl-[acyl-carrier-protein] synthase family protein [Planctomycetota bacterium]